MGELTTKYLDKQLKFWQEELRLYYWTLRHKISAEVEPETAEIHISHDYNNGEVMLPLDWPKWTEYKLNEALVHELLHAVLHQTRMAAEQANEFFTPDARKLFKKRLMHEIEQCVDHMTFIVLESHGFVHPNQLSPS